MIARDWLRIGAPTMQQIVNEVASEAGCPAEVLRRPRASGEPREITRIRHQAMWRLRQETKKSLPQIAAFLGGLDHTTVLYGSRKHAERMGEGA